MAQKFTNAARAELASTINDTDTTITIVADGALFPVANTGAVAISDAADWFKLVLQDETGIEIVFVRTHTSASLSFTNVLRGQEGTTARGFASGSVVGLRPTAADAEGVLKATFASQAEAEAGTVADKVMSPLRVAQAAAKLVGRVLPIFHADAAALRSVGGGGQIENLWTFPVSTDTSGNGFWMATNGTKVVAKSMSASNVIGSSPDSRVWTNRTMPSSAIYKPASDGTGFMAAANNSTAVAVSPDGDTWSAATALPSIATASQIGLIAGLVGTPGTYLIRQHSVATAAFLTTDNGGSYTTVTLPASNLNLCSMGGLFVAYSGSGNTYYTSPTGATGSWTTRTLPTSHVFQVRVEGAAGATLYTSLAALGSPIYKVSDGINAIDTGLRGPTSLAAQNIMIDFNGVGIRVQTANAPETVHAGKQILRAGTVPSLQTLSGGALGAAAIHKGVLLIPRNNADGTINIIDPGTPADAGLGLFIA